ncbi:MAG: transposase [Patescibacteria group bacterium]|nr:transposase [Patescibacteria group bacterium]
MEEDKNFKFLKIVNELRKKFDSSFPPNFSRTISFRIYPKKELKNRLDKWFNEISEVKFLHLKDIYERFKHGKIKLFSFQKLNYSSLYKGNSLFNELKKNYKILNSKTIEGIRIDIQSILNSFLQNTNRVINHNKKILSRNKNKILSLKELFSERNIEEEIVLIKEILNKFDDFQQIKIDENFNFNSWIKCKSIALEINQKIRELNQIINVLNIENKYEVYLSNIYEIPDFPIVEKYQNLDDYKNRFNLKKLEEVKNEFFEELDKFKSTYSVDSYLNSSNLSSLLSNINNRYINEYLEQMIDNFSKKEKYLQKNKNRKFKFRFIYWVKQNKNSLNLNEILMSLINRIKKEENHIKTKNYILDKNSIFKYLDSLLLLVEIIFVSQQEQKKRNEILNKINEELTKLKSILIKGKSIKDSFTISGFGWTILNNKPNKPNKAATLFLENDNKKKIGIVLTTSNSVYVFNKELIDDSINNKKFKFIAIKGGARQKNKKQPKSMDIKEGYLNLNKDEYSCYFYLVQGKSYLRRFLFHKKWGFLNDNKSNKFYPANCRLKRIKNKPGDDFEYYVDITFRYNGENKTINFEEIKKDIEYFIGIDRGENIPMTIAIINKEGEFVKSDFLGENLSEKLKELYKKRKTKIIRNKIKRTQETILKQSISKILFYLSKYPGLLCLENLNVNFGREKSLIAKRTYNKVIKFLIYDLELVGLVRVRNSKIYGLIHLVNPKNTSIICPKCNFNFNIDVKKKYLNNLTSDGFRELINNKKIDFKERKFNIEEMVIKLPSEWFYYKDRSNYPCKYSLEQIEEKIKNNNYEEALKIFKTIKPRISKDKFICLNFSCDYENNADLVGAINIAKRGLELINSNL